MTREEAIAWFKNNPFYQENHEPFNMAIEALLEKSDDSKSFSDSAEPSGDLISREDAMKAFAERVRDSNQSDFIEPPNWNDAVAIIGSLPSADRPQGVDCTNFIEWLKEEVLNEEMWELNAVAYGEIICRKLTKIGAMECKDGFYYALPTADRPTGEWIRHELWGQPWYTCSICEYHGRNDYNFCPNCGAKMEASE